MLGLALDFICEEHVVKFPTRETQYNLQPSSGGGRHYSKTYGLHECPDVPPQS